MTAPACVQPRHATIDHGVALGHMRQPAQSVAPAAYRPVSDPACYGNATDRTSLRVIGPVHDRIAAVASGRDQAHRARRDSCSMCDTLLDMRHPAGMSGERGKELLISDTPPRPIFYTNQIDASPESESHE
jgi:hypothetical protein